MVSLEEKWKMINIKFKSCSEDEKRQIICAVESIMNLKNTDKQFHNESNRGQTVDIVMFDDPYIFQELTNLLKRK